MSPADWILSAGILAASIAAVFLQRRVKKAGKGCRGCSGSCCSGCGGRMGNKDIS